MLFHSDEEITCEPKFCDKDIFVYDWMGGHEAPKDVKNPEAWEVIDTDLLKAESISHRPHNIWFHEDAY